MKTLRKGNKRSRWYVGLVLTCERCNEQVELEADDWTAIDIAIAQDGLIYNCRNCGTKIIYNNTTQAAGTGSGAAVEPTTKRP